MRKKLFVALSLVFIFAALSGQAFAVSLTLEEKVGQLFFIRPEQLNLDLDNDFIHDPKTEGVKELSSEMAETMHKYPAGGFVIFGKNINTPEQLKKFVSALKNSYPLTPFIAIDEEGGRVARIANSKNFNVPKIKSAASLKNPKQAKNAAVKIAAYLVEYGIDWNFAPVADVNSNPENIVIGNRAFGSDPEYVAKMVSAYLDGLHAKNILGLVKHFPGHGDTKGDTHNEYVAVDKTWDELKEVELIPFVKNFDKAGAVMIAHITLPNITSDKLPATLSKELITGKLRGELNFKGIILTDDLYMGAIRNSYNSAEAAVLAFEAGNDILLMPEDYESAFKGILNAVKTGRISEERLNQSVERILKFKGVF